MTKPATPTARGAVATRSVVALVLLVVLLLAGIACFFVFADRVPSLLQALADH